MVAPTVSGVPTAPRLDPLHLDDLIETDPGELCPRADLDAVAVAGCRLPTLELRDAVVRESRISDLVADEADLRGVRLIEVELAQVALTVVRAARGHWHDVVVSGRLGSVEAYETELRSVHFVGCRVSYLNLRGAQLLDVAFTDCVVDELDLTQATARRVRFDSTRVDVLDLQHAELHDVDLRGASLATITGVTHLRGTTVTPDQLALLAPVLAGELGIAVED